MYNEFEQYLLGYLPPNYWYDEGVNIAQDMLSDFKDDDWKQLLERLSIQDIEWKKKLAYCLYDEANKYELLALLNLLDSKDEELSIICLDSLRSFINKGNADFLINNPKFASKIKQLFHSSDKPTQVMLVDLQNKISKFTESKAFLIEP